MRKSVESFFNDHTWLLERVRILLALLLLQALLGKLPPRPRRRLRRRRRVGSPLPPPPLEPSSEAAAGLAEAPGHVSDLAAKVGDQVERLLRVEGDAQLPPLPLPAPGEALPPPLAQLALLPRPPPVGRGELLRRPLLLRKISIKIILLVTGVALELGVLQLLEEGLLLGHVDADVLGAAGNVHANAGSGKMVINSNTFLPFCY